MLTITAAFLALATPGIPVDGLRDRFVVGDGERVLGGSSFRVDLLRFDGLTGAEERLFECFAEPTYTAGGTTQMLDFSQYCYDAPETAEVWTWETEPTGVCDGLTTTSFSVAIVEPSTVKPGWDYPLQREAEATLHPGPSGAWPADWIPSPAAPLRLQAGSTSALTRTVYDPGTEERVAISTTLDIEIEGMLAAGLDEHRGHVYEIEAADLQLTANLHEVSEQGVPAVDPLRALGPMPAVVAVDPSALTVVELVAEYDVTEADVGRQWGPPRYIAAVARDDTGAVVHGVPVKLEIVDGALAVPQTEGVDRVRVGNCGSAANRDRSATVRVEAGGLSGSLELTWSQISTDDILAEECQGPGLEDEGACACRSPTREHAATLLWLVLPALRRRSARPREHRGSSPR